MATYKVKENIYSVGILNPSMRIFDVVMRTEYGTSYNSYIVKGSEKTALIETCHASFLTEYIKNIKEVCEPESIDYIILNHSEPDHSGVLNEIVKLCPKAEIYVSKPGSIYLKNITNNPSLPIKIAADQSTLDLGGKVLKFIAAPFLHWPDSMFTYIESDKLLFSCDFFGTHYCEPYVFDYNMVYSYKYKIELKSYYDAIFKPFRPYVVKGLEKYDLLDVDTICASHGPILTKGSELEYVVDKYREWSIEPKQEVKEIPIFFGSAYNNTKKIAEAIKSGILKILPDAKTEIYDLNEHCMDFLSEKLNASSAFAIGSPTINADAVPPIWVLLSHVDAINNKKKPALVFGSYGWSGEAVPNIAARLNGLKMNVFGEGLRISFVPSEEELKKAEETGIEFAKSIN